MSDDDEATAHHCRLLFPLSIFPAPPYTAIVALPDRPPNDILVEHDGRILAAVEDVLVDGLIVIAAGAMLYVAGICLDGWAALAYRIH